MKVVINGEVVETGYSAVNSLHLALMAGLPPYPQNYSITFRRKDNGELGSLAPYGTISLTEGMVINIVRTNDA